MEECKEVENRCSTTPAIEDEKDNLYEELYLRANARRNSLSNEFKILRSSSFIPKTPRLFEALEYQHIYTEKDLLDLMKTYLEEKMTTEKELINTMEREMDYQLISHIPKQIHETLPEIIEKLRCLEVLYYVIIKNCDYIEEIGTDFEINYEWDIEEIYKAKEKMYELYPSINPDTIEEFLKGKKTICVSAVKLTMNAIEGMNDMLKQFLDENSKTKNYVKLRSIVIYTIKLAFCVEFLYSSLSADKSSIFFNDTNIEDITLLNKHLDVIHPMDLDKHLKRLEKAGKNIGFYMGIAQKGFQHKSYTKSFVSMAYYTAIYGLN